MRGENGKRKRDERKDVYIYIPDEGKMGAKEKNKTWNMRKRRVN